MTFSVIKVQPEFDTKISGPPGAIVTLILRERLRTASMSMKPSLGSMMDSAPERWRKQPDDRRVPPL